MDIGGLFRDVKPINEGRWQGNLPGLGKARLLVRGSSYVPFTEALDEKLRNVDASGRDANSRVKPDIRTRLWGEAASEHLLLDWDGFTDGGVPVPFSADLALKWLTDPNFSRFADAVALAAGLVDYGKAAQQEALEKN